MIHVIGNSHVWLFNGQPSSKFPTYDQCSPYFRVKWLGATIAYNFRQHHMSSVREYLAEENVALGSKVMLVVGEVDCRWHLPYQAQQQNRSIEEITKECVERFFLCLLDLREAGFIPIGWGTHPTTTHGHVDPPGTDTHGPIFGEVVVRNRTCLLWNQLLEKMCREAQIPFVSIYHHLVDEHNVTKMEYFQDYCHLSNDMCAPLMIAAMNDKYLIPNWDEG